MSLLARDLLWLTGKGGVGRTTVAAALALLAAGRGRETLVCEIGEQERLPRLFGAAGGGGREVELRPGLSAVSIDPQAALRDWLSGQLPGPLSRVLADSRTFGYLYAAAPGARELVTMGRLWQLAGAGRLVIVDGPATGHAVGMLQTPRTFGEIARVGPLRSRADRIRALLGDPARAAFAAVTVLAETPVNETLDLRGRLRETVGRDVELIVANGIYPERFSDADLEALAAADGAGPARAAVAAARSQTVRAAGQRRQLARLRDGAEAPVAELPYVFAPELGLAEVERLARVLEKAL